MDKILYKTVRFLFGIFIGIVFHFCAQTIHIRLPDGIEVEQGQSKRKFGSESVFYKRLEQNSLPMSYKLDFPLLYCSIRSRFYS